MRVTDLVFTYLGHHGQLPTYMVTSDHFLKWSRWTLLGDHLGHDHDHSIVLVPTFQSNATGWRFNKRQALYKMSKRQSQNGENLMISVLTDCSNNLHNTPKALGPCGLSCFSMRWQYFWFTYTTQGVLTFQHFTIQQSCKQVQSSMIDMHWVQVSSECNAHHLHWTFYTMLMIVKKVR